MTWFSRALGQPKARLLFATVAVLSAVAAGCGSSDDDSSSPPNGAAGEGGSTAGGSSTGHAGSSGASAGSTAAAGHAGSGGQSGHAGSGVAGSAGTAGHGGTQTAGGAAGAAGSSVTAGGSSGASGASGKAGGTSQGGSSGNAGSTASGGASGKGGSAGGAIGGASGKGGSAGSAAGAAGKSGGSGTAGAGGSAGVGGSAGAGGSPGTDLCLTANSGTPTCASNSIAEVLPVMTELAMYDLDIVATGGTAPYQISIAGGSPADLGAPNTVGYHLHDASVPLTDVPGDATFTVTVTDSLGTSLSVAYALTTYEPPPAFTTAAMLPSGVNDQVYGPVALQTQYGHGALTFAVTNGSAPANLALDPAAGSLTGTLSGYTTETLVTFDVTATDALSRATTQTFSIDVAGYTPPVLQTPDVQLFDDPSVKDISAYSDPIQIVPGTGLGPFTVSVSQGALPEGITITNNGTAQPSLSGTWVWPGGANLTPTYTFTLHVVDSLGGTDDEDYTITFDPPATVAPKIGSDHGDALVHLEDATVGTPYTSEAVVVTGPLGPFLYKAITPALAEPGITFSGLTGVTTVASGDNGIAFAGTPTTATVSKNYSFQFTDAAGRPIAQSMGLEIQSNVGLKLTPPNGTFKTHPINDGATGYNTIIAISGGTAPYKLKVTPATTYPWAALPTAANGGLMGGTINIGNNQTTKVAAGTYAFTVLVTDSASTPNTATGTYDVVVINPAPKFAAVSQRSAKVAMDYSQTVTPTGTPNSITTWSVTGLPGGLTHTTTTAHTVISGTPTAASAETATGDYTIKVTATDAYGLVGSVTFTMHVYMSYNSNIYSDASGAGKSPNFKGSCSGCHDNNPLIGGAPWIRFDGNGSLGAASPGSASWIEANNSNCATAYDYIESGYPTPSGTHKGSLIYERYADVSIPASCGGGTPMPPGSTNKSSSATSVQLKRWITDLPNDPAPTELQSK